MHTCPVCGFNELEFPPDDYNICPSCGTEFEVDDAGVTHLELRNKWKAGGMQWWSRYEEPPFGWDPQALLAALENPTHQEQRVIYYEYEELAWFPVRMSGTAAAAHA
jgi:hypothetical protein